MPLLFFCIAVLAAVVAGILADTSNTKSGQQVALVAMVAFVIVSMCLVGLFHAALWQWVLLEGILGILCLLPLGDGLLRIRGFGQYDAAAIRSSVTSVQVFLVCAVIVAFVLFVHQWIDTP